MNTKEIKKKNKFHINIYLENICIYIFILEL